MVKYNFTSVLFVSFWMGLMWGLWSHLLVLTQKGKLPAPTLSLQFPLLSILHQFIPSLGRRAGISLETACHTAHSQHQTVPMHRHHSPPLPTACSQRFSSLQIKEHCAALTLLSPRPHFPLGFSQACVSFRVTLIHKHLLNSLYYPPVFTSWYALNRFWMYCSHLKKKHGRKELRMDGWTGRVKTRMSTWIDV